MPRYVVLEHTGTADYKPGRHWDLMLESGPSLRTWEMAELPSPNRWIHAVALNDHRLAYLDYEGPLTANRGVVRRWDWGVYETLGENRLQIAVRLDGERLNGQLRLAAQSSATSRWLLTFEPDGQDA